MQFSSPIGDLFILIRTASTSTWTIGTVLVPYRGLIYFNLIDAFDEEIIVGSRPLSGTYLF